MAGRFRRSYPGGGGRRTSKQDENDEQPHPVSYHPTAPRHHTVPHLISHQRNLPAHSTSTQRDARTRRPDKRTRTNTKTRTRTSTGTTGKRRTREHTAPQNDKQATRRTTRRQTRHPTTRRRTRRGENGKGQKSSMGDEDIRSRKNTTPHPLTFRPTPSRRLSLIHGPQIIPPPPVGG